MDAGRAFADEQLGGDLLVGATLRDEREDLADRLHAVLDAIYAAYAKGWTEIGDAAAERLAEEAIWLGRLVVSLLPDEPEAKGMLALMLYAEARRTARRDPDGAYVPLEAQDINLWDEDQIMAAEALLREANAGGPTGRYQIEAAIQSAHVARRVTGRPNWDSVVALYDILLSLTHSPVALLNRAAALAETEGPQAALSSLDAIADDRRMADYQPWWATRGHLCALAGRKDEERTYRALRSPDDLLVIAAGGPAGAFGAILPPWYGKKSLAVTAVIEDAQGESR